MEPDELEKVKLSMVMMMIHRSCDAACQTLMMTTACLLGSFKVKMTRAAVRIPGNAAST